MGKISDLGGDFEIAEEGSYVGTVVRLIDLGRQQTKYGASRMASVCFELADVTTADGKPMLAFMTIFNFSARSKKLREFVRTLTGLHDIRDVDPRTLIGMTCGVNITHATTEDGSVFANVEVKRGKPGAKRPKVKSELLYFSLIPEDFSEADLAKVPERQRDRIKSSETYHETQRVIALKGKTASEIIDDGLPDFSGLAAG